MDSNWQAWGGQAAEAVQSLLDWSGFPLVNTFVLGGSVSEIAGFHIGSQHNLALGKAIVAEVLTRIPSNMALAIQGCEHINRALVVERAWQKTYEWTEVAVWPVPEAGGSLAAAAMELMNDPVVVDKVQAEAGIDFGQTMIGMHLRPVVVPLRLPIKILGHAVVTAGRSRLPLIGGPRARYNPPKESLW